MEQRQTPRLVRYQYLEGLIDPRVVLELGCGDGALTAMLNRWAKQVVACEPDSAALARARARLQGGSVEFLTGNATPLPQPDQFFDVVWVPAFVIPGDSVEEHMVVIGIAVGEVTADR